MASLRSSRARTASTTTPSRLRPSRALWAPSGRPPASGPAWNHSYEAASELIECWHRIVVYLIAALSDCSAFAVALWCIGTPASSGVGHDCYGIECPSIPSTLGGCGALCSGPVPLGAACRSGLGPGSSGNPPRLHRRAAGDGRRHGAASLRPSAWAQVGAGEAQAQRYILSCAADEPIRIQARLRLRAGAVIFRRSSRCNG